MGGGWAGCLQNGSKRIQDMIARYVLLRFKFDAPTLTCGGFGVHQFRAEGFLRTSNLARSLERFRVYRV